MHDQRKLAEIGGTDPIQYIHGRVASFYNLLWTEPRSPSAHLPESYIRGLCIG